MNPKHLVIDGRCIHRRMGGIGWSTYHLVRALQRRNRFRISILLGDQVEDCEALEFGGTESIRVEAAMIDPRFEHLVLPGLLTHLHANIYFNPTFAIPPLKTAEFEIVTIHDVIFEDQPELVEPKLRDYLRRSSFFSAKHADRIVTVSQHAASRISSVYNVESSQITVIPNGISEQSFRAPSVSDREAIRRRIGNLPFILFLGSIEPKKGIIELIDAFVIIARNGFDGLLVLAGGKTTLDFDLDTRIGTSTLARRIMVLDYIPESEKAPLIAECCVFVYPSRYEGFGIPPLEAMALGVPTVVSDSTSLPEIVGSAALIAKTGSAEDLARLIQKALSDELTRSRLQASGPIHARSFSWERAAVAYEKLFESVTQN